MEVTYGESFCDWHGNVEHHDSGLEPGSHLDGTVGLAQNVTDHHVLHVDAGQRDRNLVPSVNGLLRNLVYRQRFDCGQFSARADEDAVAGGRTARLNPARNAKVRARSLRIQREMA